MIGRWQATQWPGAPRAIGQRVWKWQPGGGLSGLGTSPCSRMRWRFTVGSGIGTAESSASV
jgi:hypothetical protein